MKHLRPTTMRLALCAAALLLALGAHARKWTDEYERKVGTEACAEVEKQWKLLADEAKVKQLAEMTSAIAAVSERPKVQYTLKIVDTDEVNAFSIPGGFIYVTKGLLADVQSDHELAGVIAHEVTHNTLYDALERAEKNKKLFMGSLATAIGALILGAKSNQVQAALTAGEYIRLGVMSKYSLAIEQRADSFALKYMISSKAYNPVGMLTFMERLAAKERHKPKQEMGVYADHPDTDLRCRAIIDQLEDAGLDVNRRAVTRWDPPKVEEKDVAGQKVPVVSLWEVELLRVQAAADGVAPPDRAKKIADTLTKSLAEGLHAYEISADLKSPQPRVLLGSTVLTTITPEDAQAAGLPATQFAQKIVSNLGAALHKEELGRWW